MFKFTAQTFDSGRDRRLYLRRCRLSSRPPFCCCHLWCWRLFSCHSQSCFSSSTTLCHLRRKRCQRYFGSPRCFFCFDASWYSFSTRFGGHGCWAWLGFDRHISKNALCFWLLYGTWHLSFWLWDGFWNFHFRSSFG